MVEISAGAALYPESVITDFVDTLNLGQGQITEIAIAKVGTSQFNRAHYLERIREQDVLQLASLKANVSFCAGLSKELMQPLILESESNRKGADRFIGEKKILSFDLDFKANVEDYMPANREILVNQFSERLQESLAKAGIKPWIISFSGNGLHVHFKLAKPYRVDSVQRYKQVYDSVRCYLECLIDLKFDPACSNPSRLMRLPFSTNWKDACPWAFSLTQGWAPI